ncbi:MAG: Sigma factor AlgU regulatory protein MucB [Pseudomonas citronellolis]|nr:MAG: Sigma factor AlgU regulatory protein MucB [Pseudomonas citronellolis]
MRATTLLLCFFGGLLAMPVQAADALDWVKRLADVEQRQSYHGTFVYERNGVFSTHEIWHSVGSDGTVRERLLQLDGPRQEVVRLNGVTQCIGGGMAEQASTGELWPARKLDASDIGSIYELRQIGDSRIAGRNASVIAVVPRDQYRYGFELHIDDDTGLPLKSLLLNDKGQILERLQFTRLDVNAPDEAGLKASADCHAVQERTANGDAKSNWRSDWVPPGFTLNSVFVGHSTVSDDQVLSFDYGDGLARFSIFVEPLHGAKVDDARSQLGPTAVVSKHMDTEDGGVMVTVVGEIPSGTAERIAMSLRPQAPGASAQ